MRSDTMPLVKFVGSHTHPIQNIPYLISVYQFTEGFRAFSFCRACAVQNFTEPYGTADEAIEECGQLIQKHHVEKHK